MKRSSILKRWSNMPVYDLLGIRVEQAGGRRARLRLPWRPELTQAIGLVHGGIIATLADSAAGWAVFPEVPDASGCTTLEMKISYLAPVVKADMVAKAKAVKIGRSTALVDVDVFSGRTLVAKSLVTYFIRR